MANNNTSLATKWRPKVWEDVMGQETVKQILKHQVDTKTFKQGYLFCGKWGSGKAQPLSAKIMGPDGYFTMGDADVGMSLYGEDGQIYQIVGVFPQGIKDVYEITFADGSKTRCCDDHLWKVRLPKKQYEVLPLRDIRALSGKSLGYIPVCKPLQMPAVSHQILPRFVAANYDIIPQEYMIDSEQNRRDTLFSYIRQHTSWLGSEHDISVEKELADQLIWLCRSLGGKASIESVHDRFGTIWYDIHLVISPSSKRHYQRKIVSIKHVGEEKCQCIMTNNPSGLYLTDDLIVTHNTTCARIFANMINEGPHDIIEIDAATYNGVDQMRVISEEARKKPLVGKYKIFIIDECFHPDTEILTNKGFKKFSQLDWSELIAQYTEDGRIEFVKPIRYIQKPHVGSMVKLELDSDNSILMTPNHIQPVFRDGHIEKYTAAELPMDASLKIALSGDGVGYISALSVIDKLAIATAAGGHLVSEHAWMDYNRWSITLSDNDAIIRMTAWLKESSLSHDIVNQEDGTVTFNYNMPKTVSKRFSSHFSLEMNVSTAQAFLDTVMHCHGDYNSSCNGIFYSGDKLNVDFVAAVATLANQHVICNRQPADYSGDFVHAYSAQFEPDVTLNCSDVKKSIVEYTGEVYCVEVPTHMIIVRAGGRAFVSGNCHMITAAGGNAFLKLLEEPPATAMFLLCTTDPQKMLNTILSRVQRYDFTNIPTDQIVQRLTFIAEQEHINIDQDSIKYIARMANGGMRDAISSMEKCSSLCDQITLRDVTSVLATVGYDQHFKLLNGLLRRDSNKAFEVLREAYNSGKDMKRYISEFMWTVCDICNYQLFQSFDYINIPKLPDYEAFINTLSLNECLPVLDWAKSLNALIKNEPNPFNMIQVEVMLWLHS